VVSSLAVIVIIYNITSVLLTNIVWAIKSIKSRWAGHVVRMGERSGVYGILVGKPEGKRPPG
jgi:hypothetical protein